MTARALDTALVGSLLPFRSPRLHAPSDPRHFSLEANAVQQLGFFRGDGGVPRAAVPRVFRAPCMDSVPQVTAAPRRGPGGFRHRCHNRLQSS